MFIPDPTYSDLAAKYGTPLYVYHEATILQRLATLRQHTKAEIRFALKANSNIQILKILRQHGCGFDVVSGGELERALLAGIEPSKIVFSGVGKSDHEILLALKNNIQAINVESEQELEVIDKIAKANALIARVALRVNPALDAQTHRHLTTGEAHSKFGIPIERIGVIAATIEQRFKTLELVGLASHIGSQVLDAEILLSSYRALVKCADSLHRKFEFLDFGGGFGLPYSENENSLDLSALGIELNEISKRYVCLIEPGRFIVADAGVLLSKVLFTKTSRDGHATVIIDAGMNDLMRPALYDATHPIRACRASGPPQRVDIVGPVCESACVFARDYPLPKVDRGELLAIFICGAYGAAMSSNYNSRPLAAEVLIRANGAVQLIRRRQSLTEIWQNEVFD